MALTYEMKTKKRSSYPCKDCGVDIEKGETYMSVTYSDGFRSLLKGAYHEKCWHISPDNPKAKKQA